MSFQRFVARRGLPTKVYCDNATNFVEDSRALNELHEAFAAQKEDLVRYAAEQNVEFSFIPPRAPHIGGLWEATVKQVKFLLRRAVLSQEKMVTMIAFVLACLIARASRQNQVASSQIQPESWRPRDNPRGQSSVAAVVARQNHQSHRGPRRPCTRSRNPRSRKHI